MKNLTICLAVVALAFACQQEPCPQCPTLEELQAADAKQGGEEGPEVEKASTLYDKMTAKKTATAPLPLEPKQALKAPLATKPAPSPLELSKLREAAKLPMCQSPYTLYTRTLKCVATPICPSAFTWNEGNKRCEAKPTCHPPFVWGEENSPPRSICMADPICTPPFQWETSTCKADPICTHPFVWKSGTGQCEYPQHSNGSCPAGTDLINQINDICVQYFECPPGTDTRVDMPYNHFCKQRFKCPEGNDMRSELAYNYYCKDYDIICPAGTDTEITESGPQICVENDWSCPNAGDNYNSTTGLCEG